MWLSQWRSRRPLIPVPALVDSAATKPALIQRCGLGDVYDFARAHPVVSDGSLGSEAENARFALIGEADRKALREYGGAGEPPPPTSTTAKAGSLSIP